MDPHAVPPGPTTMSATWPRRWPWSGRPSPAPTASRSCRKWSTPCARASRAEVQRLIEGWLDALDADRPLGAAEAADRRPARRPLGAAGQAGRAPTSASVEVAEIEEVWHALTPPYERPVRLAGGARRTAVDPTRRPLPAGDAGPGHRRGRRLRQARRRPTTPPNGNGTASASRRCSERGVRRLYTRTGDDISATFPDLLEALDFEGVIDGELLVLRDGTRRAASATCSSG